MYILSLLILFLFQFTEPPEFKRYDTSGGLSNNIIHDVYQDSEGFLWVATENGLNRFDGSTFQVFKHIPGDSTSLSHNIVTAVFEDHNNRLWVGTWNGLNRFDKSTHTFKRFPEIPELGPYRISSNQIIIDSAGCFWYPSAAGYFRFDPLTENFSLVNPKDAIPQEGRNVVMVDKSGHTWFYNEPENFLASFDIEENKLTEVPLPDNTRLYYSFNSKKTWVNSQAGPGLQELSPAFIPDPPPVQSEFRHLLEDQNGNIWMGSDRGVFFWDTTSAGFTNITEDKLGSGSLSYQVEKLYEDKWGGIWIGTRNGLFHYNPLQKPFHHLDLSKAESSAGISQSSIVMSIEETGHGLWFGTLGAGLYLYNPVTGSISQYEVDPSEKLNSNQVWGIFHHPSTPDLLWLATTNGVYRFHINSKKSERIALPFPPQLSSITFSIIAGNDSSIWVSGNADVYQIDIFTGELIERVAVEQASTVQALNFYDSHRLFITTQGAGLSVYDLESKKIQPARISSFSIEIPIWEMYTGKNDIFWLATGNGLFALKPGLSEFRHVTGQKLRSQRVFYSILEDQQNRIWIGSDNGLFMYSAAEEEFWYYDATSGLENLEFNRRAALEDREGTFWFGGTNGVTYFKPSAIIKNPHPPPVHVTSIRIFEERGEREIFPNLQNSLELEWFENTFEIDFTAVDFTNPSKLNFRYRLAGVDPGWVEQPLQRLARYTNLSPGEYTFRVQAANSDGIWNEEGAKLAVVIHPPFWKTSWAYALYTALLIAGIFGFIRYRTRFLEKERRKLEQMVKERTNELEEQHELTLEAKRKIEMQANQLKELDDMKSRFFANISHELRTPLTLIDAPLQQILADELNSYPKEKLGQKLQGIRRNSHRLGKLIDELLDLSRLKENSIELNPVEVNITNWFSLFVDSYQSVADSKSIRFSAVQELSSHRKVLLDVEKFDKITSNLVNNALKFTGENEEIRISLRVDNDELVFSVLDTGTGIPGKDLPKIFDRFYQSNNTHGNYPEGLGLGLALSRELAEALGGSLDVESKLGEGSTFTLKLPVELAQDEEEQPGYPLQPEAVQQPPTSQKNKYYSALIVEDNAEMRTFLVQLLEQDFEVFQANNGKQALEKLKTIAPNLIVSDLMMPEMDGLELTGHLRSVPNFSHIPILMLTARASDEDRLQSLRVGVDDYLSKPFIPEEVRVRSINLANNHKKRMTINLREKDDEPPPEEQELNKILSVVEEHLDDTTLSVNTLAGYLHTSERQLYRTTQRLTGMTPIEYINSIRLNKARELLRSGSAYTIDVIAEQVGFKSRSYFSRLFKKAYGITPGKFQSEK